MMQRDEVTLLADIPAVRHGNARNHITYHIRNTTRIWHAQTHHMAHAHVSDTE